MEILKAKVTKDNTLVASYKNENGDTVTIEGKNLVTKDLTNSFRDLVPHLTFLCEQKEAAHLERMDELPDDIYSTLEVSGYTVGGSDDSLGVTLIGKRFLKSKKVLNLCAPFTMFNNENEEYTYAFELEQAIEACSYEVEQYLFEKKWAVVQQELPFKDEEPVSEITSDEAPEVNLDEFQADLEKLTADSNITIMGEQKVKGRHRKVKKDKATTAA
ncbi:hypothetical protein [Bacteroides xylanisolvens]|jgi:hypothetical protein|uniref:hypothetical protein n=1 Tax=Bacteroides xylanisolvens TaxID=371601 RepID=UPI001C8B455B|nr:hypothetical protein [Bacteroides xylanisolvens]